MPDTKNELQNRLARTAFAFRGYNVTNIGRSQELLAHPAYGDIVEAHLREASELCSDIVKRPVDLVERVRAGRETTGLEVYADDVALIVAMEIAQLRLLEEHFGILMARGQLAFGYSLGECSALIGAGVYAMRDMLSVPLAMADDCAGFGRACHIIRVDLRGPILDFDIVRRLCLEICQEGRGVIDVSTYLSPNSLLLMGQNGTIKRFESQVHKVFPHKVSFRPHNHRYPPLHTPIMWQRSIPNRAAVMFQTVPGGLKAPSIPILSMVTGLASYQEINSRDLLNRWVDHPQRLWDVIYRVLGEGVETVIHVGPNPNLLPATFKRLANAIVSQTNGFDFGSLGRRTISRLVRRPWLTRVLPSSAVLFRAPFVQHIILEDWLLEHGPDQSPKAEGEAHLVSATSGI